MAKRSNRRRGGAKRGGRQRSSGRRVAAPASAGGREFAVGLGLVVLTGLVYWRVAGYPFVLYDDGPYVYENPIVRGGLTPESIRWAFGSLTVSNYHPLTWISHMLDCELFGPDAAGAHHLTSLLIHIVNSLLTFAILSRLTGCLWRPAFVAALFALHPLHVESVAWVAERKDVLSQFFWLLSIGAYAAWTRRRTTGRYVAVTVLLVCALLSKPMAVTAPFVFLLLDYWPLARVPNAGTARDFGRLIAEKLPWFALCAAAVGVAFHAQVGSGSLVEYPLGHRIATALTGYARYLGKTLWPSDLAVLYPNRPGMWSGLQVAAASALIVAITAVVFWLRERRYLVVGWLWFLGTLVPVIGLVGLGGHSLADRYMYMPQSGLAIAVAWGAAEIAGDDRTRQRWFAAGAALVLSACVWLSAQQVAVWSSSRALFAHALSVTDDNAIVQNNLGGALRADGDDDAAEKHFRESIRIDPDFPPPYLNLGDIEQKRGRYAEAIAAYRAAQRADPNRPDVHRRLGRALLRSGEPVEATRELRIALRFEPDDPMLHHDLGLALAQQGQLPEALRLLERGLQLDPDNAFLHTTLGNVLALQGDLEVALVHHREAVQLVPGNASAHQTLAGTLMRLGRVDEAGAEIEEARRLTGQRGGD